MHLIKRVSILHGKKHGNKIVDKISRSIGILNKLKRCQPLDDLYILYLPLSFKLWDLSLGISNIQTSLYKLQKNQLE